VRDPSGKALTLVSVEVAAPTTLRLRLTKPVPSDQVCKVSYGHPYSTALGTIADIRKGTDTEALVLTRSFAEPLKSHIAEGAFLVTNITGPNTRVAIRRVTEEKGVTLLHYEPRELRNLTPFAAGQFIVVQRSFSYGNLRDSDPGASVHRFADATYGTRAGQPYPLWNWCVLFSDLPVD